MQMQKAIIGKKVGMTQIFDESGKVIPVTVIEAGPCVVTQKKTTEKDGYNAVQLGFEDVKESKLTKPELGHLKKAEVALKKHLKEFRVEKAAEMNVGDEIKASVFAVGDKVDVTGISKGHGYEGPVKRCGGHRTPMTHGGGPVHRQAGSMGPTSSPSRIFKGHHGAGQMGVEQVTVENLDIVKVDDELNMIVVRGAIPGPKGGVVYIKNTVKNFKAKGAAANASINPQKASVFDMAGKQVGEIELSDAIFGIEPNEAVVHDVVKNHLANCRQGTQSSLTRAEVSGGGIKPWRQKGTGRARQGSIRAPQWTHGGIVFAPKPRDYSYTLNKKVKRLALKSVLSAKAQEENIVVIDEIKLDAIKTKPMASFLKAVGADTKALVVTAENNEVVVKSAAIIPGVLVTFANLINVYDILNAKKLVVDKAALAKIEEVFA